MGRVPRWLHVTDRLSWLNKLRHRARIVHWRAMGKKKKIADNAWLKRASEVFLEKWIRLAHATSTWDKVGFEDMERCLKNGDPIIIVLWHQRVMMSPYLFDPTLGTICSLTSTSRAGRMAGNVAARFGLNTIAMHSRKQRVALTRAVLRKIRQGSSVGVTADGPSGPARTASLAPVKWAGGSGKRVFLVSFSAKRVHVLPTWDKMWFPALWTRGVYVCREWRETVPRFADEAETERLRLRLQVALNAVTDESDRAVGRIPEK